MPKMTNEVIAALAELYQPYLLFDPMERLFPAVAEEWLNHQATERWDHAGTHERGTAVLLVQSAATGFSSADVLAGSDAPAGGPLQLTAAPPNGIGRPFPFDPSSQDLFLDCAGWTDTTSLVSPGEPTFTTGSIEYLDKLFSAVAEKMTKGAIHSESPEPPPKFDLPRSTSSTVYAEVEWAGRYPRLDQARVAKVGGQQDFPSSISMGVTHPAPPGLLTDLDSYVVINYYLFYPAMEPSPVAQSDPDARNREGQWEAISIFIKGDPDYQNMDPDGRPDFGGLGPTPELFKIPRFAVYSHGYTRDFVTTLGDDTSSILPAEVRPWQDPLNRPSMSVNAIVSHPIAYVTALTHRNFFEIAATVTKGQTQPDPGLLAVSGVLLNFSGGMAGVCIGIIAATVEIPPAALVVLIVCIIIAAILLTIALILFVLAFVLEPAPPVTESPQSSAPGTDVARDGGPAGIPSGSVGPALPGLPPTSVVDNALRVVSRFRLDNRSPVTTYPLPAPGVVEMPTWWLFPGRWGVRVKNRASSQWDSGTRRVDAFERSRGYWNAYHLVRFLSDKARAEDGITG